MSDTRLTWHIEHALLPQGWASSVRVAIANGLIVSVESDAPANGAARIAGVALPGMANVHSHAFQRGMAGLAEWRSDEADDFWSWRAIMYRFLGVLEPGDVEVIAALAQMEMLEAGFTAVAEFHYLHNRPDGGAYDNPAELAVRVAAAAQQTGIGLTLLPVFYARGDFGGAPPQDGQRRFILDLERYRRLVDAAEALVQPIPFGRVGVAPHSLRAVTPEELQSLTAHRPDAPIHIHAAEQEREVERALAALGARPVQWLLDHAGVDRRWCLVHATHLDEGEVTALARSGAVAGLCPETEANLGDGIFPAVSYIADGGRFGIGGDSHIWVSLAGELKALDYSQRLRDRARARLATTERSSGRVLYEAAAAGGAQALGRPMGSIAPGCAADLVVLDPEEASLIGRTDDSLLDSWIYASPGRVREVYVAGRRIVAEGSHVARERVLADWRRVAARLREAL